MGVVLLTSAFYRVHSASILADTASNFLASLTAGQKAKAVFGFTDDQRFDWHYVPKERKGLPFREMSVVQKHLAHGLLNAGLSSRGYQKAVTIMSLEDVLREMENDDGERRNPEKYYFSIFGEPSEKGTWGCRVEGHHVSLNFTMVNGIVVASPNFFGANPAEVRQGGRAGLRILGREEDLGRELVTALTPAQKSVAIVAQDAYDDILTETSRQAALNGQPTGLSAAEMTAPERELLGTIIGEYAHTFPHDVAQVRLEQARNAGNDLYFAWAGVEHRGGAHYYRIQSPTFVIEYDNTQNDANHIHTVWRDFDGDWGRDLLKEHYQDSSHHPVE